jgi:hypothetical protein
MPNGCIHWLGARSGDYGRVGILGRCLSAHRVAFTIANGPIPQGKIVRHKCDNPICCATEHLELGTYEQNTHEMWERGRGCPPRGERAGNHRLTFSEVATIKKLINQGDATQKELARRYGVSYGAIHSIR